MFSRFSSILIRRLGWVWIGLFLLVAPAYGQSDSDFNLKGVIDIHVHPGPDSVPRVIDADDLAQLAKKMGMRGMVFKNHWEDTAALAYVTRKEVPGIEIFGGITMDGSNGGINLEAVEHMAAMKGGWGRVVWLPTFDSEHDVKRSKEDRPFVAVSENGHLLPSVLQLIDYIAQHHDFDGQHHDLLLETGHISAEEGLMVVHEAHARGVTHIVVTHAMGQGMTIPQMQAAAKDGAFLEFVYGSTGGKDQAHKLSIYADAIQAVGAKYCILSSDFGGPRPAPYERPLEPQGMLDFMEGLHKAGISVADINLMAKTNPALALGLQP